MAALFNCLALRFIFRFLHKLPEVKNLPFSGCEIKYIFYLCSPIPDLILILLYNEKGHTSEKLSPRGF